MNSPDIVLVGGVRTAIGTFGGALKDAANVELASHVVREAVSRAAIRPDNVDHVVFGGVLHTDPRDMYLARFAAVDGGLPVETPAVTVNRLCGSGLQAIVSAAQVLASGQAETVVAGGSELMSRAPYWNTGARWGLRMGDAPLLDAMVGALTDPFDDCHMGITAENVAAKWGIDRTAQDTLAVESHKRAANAIDNGYFADQITPYPIKIRRKESLFTTDEHVRADSTVDKLAGMKPVFRKDGTVTAGNASGINDAAAAVVMMTRKAADAANVQPMARLVGYAHAGVEPKYMGIGPVPAVKRLLDNTGISVDDLDVIELNEAFAAQALAVIRDLGLDPARTNPNGSGISLGHPVGATGCILSVKAIYELKRTGGRYALVTMCIGGGQGIAAIFERI